MIMSQKAMLFAYIPVLHRGYQEFFAKYEGAELYLLDRAELMTFEELEYLKKDIRVLDIELASKAIKSWQIFNSVKPIKLDEIDQIIYADQADDKSRNSVQFIFTGDDIGHFIADKFFASVEAKTFEPIFLRWDKNLMSQPEQVPTGVSVSKTELESKYMRQAFIQAGYSSDWWRHVGSVLVRGEDVLLASHNQHLPTEDQQYKNGDPRTAFNSGVGGEFSSSIHAEAALLAQAARQGLAVEGATLYATTFPCPVCAKQIAAAGIKKLYYAKGYAVLDGLEIMQTAGVEVVKVDFSLEELHELEKLENQRSRVIQAYYFSS